MLDKLPLGPNQLVFLALAGIAAMMAVGAAETMASGTRTMVLGVPLAWPIALAAGLLAWLAVVTFADACARDGDEPP